MEKIRFYSVSVKRFFKGLIKPLFTRMTINRSNLLKKKKKFLNQIDKPNGQIWVNISSVESECSCLHWNLLTFYYISSIIAFLNCRSQHEIIFENLKNQNKHHSKNVPCILYTGNCISFLFSILFSILSSSFHAFFFGWNIALVIEIRFSCFK